MAKKLGLIVMLLMCLLIVEFTRAQEESPSPALSPEPESLADSPPPPSSSPELASSPEPESLADSPSPPPPPPPQPESPSAPSPSPSYSSPSPGPAPVPAPSDDDSDDDSEQETEYFPSPAPSPAPEVGKPDDIKASDNTPEDGEEFEEASGEENGMSGLKKAGIAIGAILGVGAIVIGALVYKKRKDNMTRARYTYFNQGEFL